MPGKILVLSADPDARIAFSGILRRMSHSVQTVSSGRAMTEALDSDADGFTALLIDCPPAPHGEKALEQARSVSAQRPDLCVVAAAAAVDIASAARAGDLRQLRVLDRAPFLEQGCAVPAAAIMDLVRLFDDSDRLKTQISRLSRAVDVMGAAFKSKYDPAGKSELFCGLMQRARELSSIPRPVLITGERGTGKEIVAGAMHFMGPRSAAPFVTVNCSALQGTLLESELFGHEKGAFTGADRRRTGKFEAASGGTLFLDEIGDMAQDFQAKVLRVIEYQEFERIGGNEKVRVDVRVVAATNADLRRKMRDGTFREDLYDRISFAVIEVPPLRDRPDDIAELVERFSRGIAAEVPGVKPRRFAKPVMDALMRYPWPGNIRELKNVVERLTCLSRGGDVALHELPGEILSGPAPERGFEEMVDGYQIGLINDALRKCGGSQKRAAAALRLTYDQFRHLVRKFGIKENVKP